MSAQAEIGSNAHKIWEGADEVPSICVLFAKKNDKEENGMFDEKTVQETTEEELCAEALAELTNNKGED